MDLVPGTSRLDKGWPKAVMRCVPSGSQYATLFVHRQLWSFSQAIGVGAHSLVRNNLDVASLMHSRVNNLLTTRNFVSWHVGAHRFGK